MMMMVFCTTIFFVNKKGFLYLFYRYPIVIFTFCTQLKYPLVLFCSVRQQSNGCEMRDTHEQQHGTVYDSFSEFFEDPRDRRPKVSHTQGKTAERQ